MSFLDRAKDLVDQHDEQVDRGLDGAGDRAKERFAGHESQVDGLVDHAQQRTGDGDTTRRDVLPDTGPGTADGGPAQEQQFEPEGTPGAGDGTVQE